MPICKDTIEAYFGKHKRIIQELFEGLKFPF